MGDVVDWLKYQTSKQINLVQSTPGEKIFQRSYHDHVIRSEADYLKIWEYIDTNPIKWKEDCFYNEEEARYE